MNEDTNLQTGTETAITYDTLLSAVLPCQVYYPADKRNVELKEIKGDKAIIQTEICRILAQLR